MSTSLDTLKEPMTRLYRGVMVLGTGPRCGKTLVTTAISATLIQQGFTVQAYKPLEFCQELSVYRGLEQAFMDKITNQWKPGETLCVPSPDKVLPGLWHRLRERCMASQVPMMLEGLSSVGSIWMTANHSVLEKGYMDTIDVMEEFQLSPLVVCNLNSRYPGQWMDEAHAAIDYLIQRGHTPVGWVGCYPQTELLGHEPPAIPDNQEQLILQFAQWSGVSCLGVIPFSPSINVQSGQQGNCLRLVEEHIDLLPVQMALGLSIRV